MLILKGLLFADGFPFPTLLLTNFFLTFLHHTDKILLDGVPVITYRVLGYLLLGIVRIYSKKVEYLFDDCHDVLMKIKFFLVSKKFKAQKDTLRAPYYSITLPDRYELDAFDFEVDEEISG